MEFDVTIEIPKGHPTSTKWTTTGRIRLTGCCSRRWPTLDYGYVEDSLGEERPSTPSSPGRADLARMSRARLPIGMFHMRDEAGGDDKILCVPAGDLRKANIKELEDISEFWRLEIQHSSRPRDLEPASRSRARTGPVARRRSRPCSRRSSVRPGRRSGSVARPTRQPPSPTLAYVTPMVGGRAARRAELATKEHPLSDD